MIRYDECSEAFTEREPIYHYDNILFLYRHIRPDPYFSYILMNKKFVLYIHTDLDHLIELDFRGNVNKPSEADIEEIKEQIFKFFAMKNSLGLPMTFMEKNQTTFEIIGVEK